MSNAPEFDFNPDNIGQVPEGGGIAPIGGELPYNIQIPTGKLLDILTSQDMDLEESPLDLLLNADPGISPMPPLAWTLLAFIVGTIAWGYWQDWRDQRR